MLNKNKLYTVFITFLVAFSFVCFVDWNSRYEKPVWDTVGGIFAPAIYLSETGFDFPALLAEPGFPQAGPNVHVYTPITIVTAAVMSLFNGDNKAIYLSLHLIQFFLTGMLLTVVFNLSRSVFGIFTALLITVAVMVFPPFLIQSRYMYMEIGGSLCVMLAFSNWVKHNYLWASIAAIAACVVKSFGLPIIACLTLLFLLEKGDRAKRAIYIGMMVVFGIGVELLRWMQGTNMAPATHNDYISYLVNQFHSRLTQTPDLYLLLLVLLLGGTWYLLKNWNTFRSFVSKAFDPKDVMTEQRIVLGGVLMVAAFVGFIITVPLSGMGFYPLTRYYIWIWPVMVITLVALGSCVGGGLENENKRRGYAIKALINVMAVVLIGFFWCNTSGKYYPNYGKDITAFSIAERSMEYMSFNAMQSSLLKSAEKIDDRDVYLNLFDTFYTSSSMMGYVDHPKANFKNIVTYHTKQADLSEYPDNFVLVLSNVAHGGQYMSALIYKALKAPDIYEVKLLDDYNIDGFTGSIVGISKIHK
ncbi:hypothetical protein [Porticoccus sp.]